MVFNPNIPKPDDLLSQSQQDLLNNNAYLNASFSVNHVPLNTAINNGKHTFVEMPVRGAIPAGLVASEGTLYTKSSTGSQLFFSPDNSGNEYQITRTIAASFALFSTNTNYPPSVAGQDGGWTFLPGGMLLQYGIRGVAAKGTATIVNFPINFTNPPFSISIGSITGEGNSPDANNQFVKDGTVTISQFQIVNSSSSSARKIYWMAIGK